MSRKTRVKHNNLSDAAMGEICPKCGIQHDRDINAAINILNISKKKYKKSIA